MKIKVESFGDLKNYLDDNIIVDLKDYAKLGDLLLKLKLMTKTENKDYIEPYKIGADLLVLVNDRNIAMLNKPFSLNDGERARVGG